MLTTLTPKLYLGIDAGGTHTEAILSDESGFVLGKSILQYGANLHNAVPQQIYEVLFKAASAARANAEAAHPDRDIASRKIDVLCVGMSGYDTFGDATRIREFISKLGPEDVLFSVSKLIFVSSGLIALKAGTEKSHGISVTIGTGTHVYGVTRDGREQSSGGWGYFLGDQGSGYWIARALMRQTMREYDGRSPVTPISRKVLDALGAKDASELVDWSYRQRSLPIAEIARLSKIVNDPDLENSYEVNDILNESVKDIVDAYKAVVSRLSMESARTNDLPIVLSGGLMAMKANYAKRVIQAIMNVTPYAQIIQPRNTPAWGAIRLIQESERGDIMPRSALVMINPKRDGAPQAAAQY